MGCGESKHAVATENTISKSKNEKSNSKGIAESFVEEQEKLIKEPGVDGHVEERGSLEERKENAKVTDNGNGESKVVENVKEIEKSEEGKENAKVEEEKEGGNAKVTDKGNGESKVVENVKEIEKSEEGKENAKAEEEKEEGNAKETDNGNGKSKVEENVKTMENSEVEKEKEGGNAKESDNGKPEGKENVKEKEEKLEAPIVVVEENKEGKSDEISVHQEIVAAVQEPDVEKLKKENESIIPEENASEGKKDFNDNAEGKEIIEEAKEESKTEEAIKVENATEVKEEVVLPIAETEDSATKKE